MLVKGARAYETRLTTMDEEVFTAHWIKTEVFLPTDNIHEVDVVEVINPDAKRQSKCFVSKLVN